MLLEARYSTSTCTSGGGVRTAGENQGAYGTTCEDAPAPEHIDDFHHCHGTPCDSSTGNWDNAKRISENAWFEQCTGHSGSSANKATCETRPCSFNVAARDNDDPFGTSYNYVNPTRFPQKCESNAYCDADHAGPAPPADATKDVPAWPV